MTSLLSIAILGLLLGTISLGSTIFIYQRLRIQQTHFFDQIDQAEHDFYSDIQSVPISELMSTEAGRQLLAMVDVDRVWGEVRIDQRITVTDEEKQDKSIPEQGREALTGSVKSKTTNSFHVGSTSKVNNETTPDVSTAKKPPSKISKPEQSPKITFSPAFRSALVPANIPSLSEKALLAQKHWKGMAPNIVGRIVALDTSQRIKHPKPSFFDALISLFPSAAFLPFMRKQEETIFIIRVEDLENKKITQAIANVAGQYTPIDLGDTISIWGQLDSGIVTVENIYNHNTQSFIIQN